MVPLDNQIVHISKLKAQFETNMILTPEIFGSFELLVPIC